MQATIKHILSILLLLSTLISCGQKPKQSFWTNLPVPRGWVNDFENLFTINEQKYLDSIVSAYKARTSVQMAIVTLDTNSTTKERFDDLTLHITKTWGIGEKGKNNGILIGISRGFRQMRIQNGYGIERRMSDNQTKQIIDNYFIPGFKKSNYYKGTLDGLNKIIEHLDKNP